MLYAKSFEAGSLPEEWYLEEGRFRFTKLIEFCSDAIARSSNEKHC